MSGQQVGTIVGQVVGSYFGPVGAAIGGFIGGAIGGSFDPDIINRGPRLTDLRIQTSAHGNAIPLIYGGPVRIAGNLIWSSDIREIANETDQGKGGPSITQIDYTYEVDVAILIGEGELTGVPKMYANGVLVYDVTSGTSPQNVFASGQWVRAVRFYTGSETQLPEPLIEAAHGVGNVSAYRGSAYMVLEGVQLNVLQTGSIPNFEFTPIRDGTIEQYIRKVVTDGISYSAGAPRVTLDNNVIRVVGASGALVDLYNLDGELIGTDAMNSFETQRPDGDDAAWLFPGPTVPGEEQQGVPVYFDSGTPEPVHEVWVGNKTVTPLLDTGRELVAAVICADNKSIILFTRATGDQYADEWVRVEWDTVDLTVADEGTIDPTIEFEYNLGGPSALYSYFRASFAESDGRTIWIPYGAGGHDIDVLQIGSDGVMRRLYNFNEVTFDGIEPGGGFTAPAIYADFGIAVVVAGDALFVFSRIAEIAGGGMAVADIIADLCNRSNIPADEYDVTDIDSISDGFVVGQMMTARAAIETLRPAYFFDAVDGEKLKFIERGGAPVGRFEYLDLGAGHDQAKDIVLASDKLQERELPSRVNLKYIASSADLQTGTQSARRETAPSRETMEVNLAVVMTDDYAAKVADIILRDAWISSTRRQWSTGLDYAKYEGTDVVEVDDGRIVRRQRIAKRVDSGCLIDWEGIDEEAEAYTSNAIGVPLQIPPQALIVQGPTSLQILDLPPLTELPSGNESAVYMAARGYLPSWQAARVDISRDGGGFYETGPVISVAAVMGVALTALADFDGGNVFDESSSVRVDVGPGTLSSATRGALLDGANPCVIGNEILQYRSATEISDGVYDLRGFLRGRKGTEREIGQHGIGDRFVLLTSSTIRNLPLNVGDRLNNALFVRATTSGLPPSSGNVQQVAPDLARLMPYSPVHLSATRDGSDDWFLTWTRRDRYMNDWNDGVDVPMSETAELYDVEILDSGDVVETYTDVSDQFIEVPSSVLGAVTEINFRVYQKSSVVGRGFAAEATIEQA